MQTGKTGNTSIVLSGIGALIAFFMPWLSIPLIGEDFSYNYTPFRLMTEPGILPNQNLAGLLLLLEPIGALMLITGVLMGEQLRKGALYVILIGNALEIVAIISFYMLAFGQESFPSSPSIGFWAAILVLLFSLTGWFRGLRAYREQAQFFAQAAATPKRDPEQVAPGA